MQQIFRSALKGPLRDKARACHNCRSEPAPSSEPYLVCSGCKRVVYCSRECQKKDWKIHKSLCLHTQKEQAKTRAKDSLNSAIKPFTTLEARINLLSDFSEVYSWSIQKAIHSALRLDCGLENFDYSKRYMQICLSYRPECDGNPSDAFRVESATFQPLDQLLSRPESGAARALEAGRPMREADESRLRAEDNMFQGILIVSFSMEGYTKFHPIPICRLSPQLELGLARMPHDIWLEELQETVRRGAVFMKLQGDPFAKLGFMKKVGSKWNWVRTTEKELEDMGLPPNFQMLL